MYSATRAAKTKNRQSVLHAFGWRQCTRLRVFVLFTLNSYFYSSTSSTPSIPSMPTLRRREIQARFGHPRKTEIIHCDAVRTVDNVMPCSTSLPDTTSTTYTPATKIHWKIKNERQRTEEKIKRNGETAEAIIHQDSVHDTDRKEHQQADVKCPVHEARWKRNENSKCYPDQFPLSGGFPQRESMTSSFFNCLQ